MAIRALKLCGLKNKFIYKSLKKIKDVNGRMELVRTLPNNIRVFVDYAHHTRCFIENFIILKK